MSCPFFFYFWRENISFPGKEDTPVDQAYQEEAEKYLITYLIRAMRNILHLSFSGLHFLSSVLSISAMSVSIIKFFNLQGTYFHL